MSSTSSFGEKSPRAAVGISWTRILLAAAAVASVLAYFRGSAGPPHPNIVLVVTDDQRVDEMDLMPTVLREIAGNGVRFENAFAVTPLCAPSRASILTGQYPTTHGLIANANPDPAPDGLAANGGDKSTLATWLNDQGYRTALFGKYLNHFDKVSHYIPPGWDEWYGFVRDTNLYFDYALNENGCIVNYGREADDYSTDVLAKHAVELIHRSNRKTPLFIYFAPFAPHAPSEPAPRHAGKMADVPHRRPPSLYEELGRSKPGWLRWLVRSNRESSLLQEKTGARASQLESLLAVDDAVASILKALRSRDLEEDTVIIVTSDHGLLWGEHGWLGKQVAYEEAIRIPLAMRYPARWPEARTVGALVSNVDIAPTIVELAGIAAKPSIEGHSMVPLADGENVDTRKAVIVRHYSGGFLVPPWAALRTNRYKLIRSGAFEELYDIQADPYEMHNLASDLGYRDIREDLANQLDAHLENAAGSEQTVDQPRKARTRRGPEPQAKRRKPAGQNHQEPHADCQPST